MTDKDRTESFDILLIEDNEGDAVLIEKYLERIDDDLLPKSPFLRHEPDLTAGFEYLNEKDVDLLLLDLGLPESKGLDTLHRVLEENDEIPVVVLTGLDDDETAVRAVKEGAQDYLKKDRIDVDGLGRALRYATERKAREKEADRQRRLNRMVQDVLVRSSTRDEIERRFCERLVEHEPYVFAWIGDLDRDGRMVPFVSSTGGGNDSQGDGYVEAVSGVVEERGGGDAVEPSARVAESREPVFVQDVDETDGSWTYSALEHGFVSVASVPLTYNEVSYGVLSAYSDEKNVFTETERGVLSDIAETLAYSLDAVSKETALFSEKESEFEMFVEDPGTYLTEMHEELEETEKENAGDTETEKELEIRVRGTVPVEDGFLQFVDVDNASSEEVVEAVSSRSVVREAEKVDGDGSGGRYRFEILSTTPEAYLLNLGVSVRSTYVSSRGVELRVSVPSSIEVREVVGEMESRFGSVSTRMYRGSEQKDKDSFERTLTVDGGSLTQKQRQALRAAYYSGYFEQPKLNSAEEIAETLGISRSTFLQHLRAAQKKVFGGFFD